MSRIPSIKEPLFIVVHNDDGVCYFEPELEPKWGGDWQPHITNNLEKARRECDRLRGTFPGQRYEVKQLSFTDVHHPGPDWNRGM